MIKIQLSIVDECQRLSIKDIVEIVKKSKFTFLFGDNKQAFFKNNILDSGKQLKEKLENEYRFNVSLRVLKKSRRYNDEVNIALEFLTNPSNKKPKISLPTDYKIDVFYDENKFIDEYESTTGIKKIYTPIYHSCNELIIGNRKFIKAKYNDDGFSVWSDSANYYGITFHALSFDIDHCFVYLKSTNMIKFNNKQYIFYKNNIEGIEYSDIQIYMNELNVLFTRGRKSLKILADDIETYLYLNSLINKLK